jgi:EAL domain-containing protein (putative c-di-GMP-specific phosphodiesterase class I)
MPIDVVKVDKRFLASCDDGGHGRELLKAILNIGRVLSLVTIAEGIEQQTQLETARELDCDLAQGYLFSRPVPADQAEQMIVAEATTRRALEAATISGAVANPPMP